MFSQIQIVNSSNENVKKLVFTKEDAIAEAVLYKYPTYQERIVICCSTQSGCPVGCRFCGAGEYFNRSLTAEEILFQVNTCVKIALETESLKIDDVKRMQIMFMSMGEPALNQKELVLALHKLYEDYPRAALLISTSAPKVDYSLIFAVSAAIPTIGLQFSIHESTDEARNKLIPLKGKLTLREISHLGNAWAMITGRTPFFNYCVHPDNSSTQDVDRLWELFSPMVWQSTLSVICERDEGVAAANARQRSLTANFEQLMLEKGFNTRMFDPAGQDDIGGGCGQLWFVQKWLRENPQYAKKTCGTGLPTIHTPTESA